jgi:hypothetical protein
MRLLVISPHFPPTNAADHQRVRMLLPYLRESGWEAEVLAVDSANVASPVDNWLAAGLPPDVPVYRITALGLGWSRLPGFGSLTFRALGALRRKGDELLQAKKFDLIYFSTTQFGVHVLGPRWLRKFRIPFIMDYQDPWVSDYYRTHPEVTPPGGRFKYAIADWLNRRQEPRVLRHCAGITSVSPDYPEQLRRRYAWLKLENWEREDSESRKQKSETLKVGNNFRFPNFQFPLLSYVLPFPGDERDLTRVANDGIRQTIFSPGDGKVHWVYVGVYIQQMSLALRGIFGALQNHGRSNPGFLDKLRLHFIGTSYAAAGRGQKTIGPLAAEFGLADMVEEHTARIPYAQALRCLLAADALIVPGSDDPSYTASKIYPYLLARRPLLAVFHANSSVVKLIEHVQGGVVIPFQTGEASEAIAAKISPHWFQDGQFSKILDLDREAFEPHTAPAQARQLCHFFDHCLAP